MVSVLAIKKAKCTIKRNRVSFIFLPGTSVLINPLYGGNPLMTTLENSEDPDKMQHNAAFHQGLHCLLRAIPGKGVRGGDGRQL